jgi:hypothetical protein
LYSRFVGVTAGLGTPRALNWTGSRKTAPETPTGEVATEIRSPATNPSNPDDHVTTPVGRPPPRSAPGPTSDRVPLLLVNIDPA